MYKFSSKSGGVPFQISFFLGDLTRNDPCMKFQHQGGTGLRIFFLIWIRVAILENKMASVNMKYSNF